MRKNTRDPATLSEVLWTLENLLFVFLFDNVYVWIHHRKINMYHQFRCVIFSRI